MTARVVEAKAAIRNQVLARLRSMSQAERVAGSERIRKRLEGQPVWKRAERVLLYASYGQEVDTWPLIEAALRAGKRVGLPRYVRGDGTYTACEVTDLSRDLVVGQLGIREPGEHCRPLPLNPLDLVVVPGVAFDLDGCRLGRGKGYYDRLLAAICAITCGVGFDEQIVDRLPVELHDISLNCILTPTRWIQLTVRTAME